MAKLCQIVAVVNGKKSTLEKVLTGVYQKLQKPDLFSGLSRKYRPLDEEGETFPSEEKLPQYTASKALEEARETLVELIDSVATQDLANTQAKASIVVDGKIIVKDVPVTHLMFLEKQLIDIQTFVSKIPTLDPAERWSFDSSVDYFVTGVSQTNRTKKVLRNHVKAEATDKFPAQVDVYSEDVKVGTWDTIKFSGCIESSVKNNFLKRIKQVMEAVKFAREEANSVEVEKVEHAEAILDYIFAQ